MRYKTMLQDLEPVAEITYDRDLINRKRPCVRCGFIYHWKGRRPALCEQCRGLPVIPSRYKDRQTPEDVRKGGERKI